MFWLLVRRDLALALRRPAALALPVVFFVLAAALFPFAVGPDAKLLLAIAPGVLWVAALLAALLIPVAFFLPVTGVGRALMIASVLLVLIVELVNSAIEATVDRVSLDRHHLSKRAKDIGSAAVFLALSNVVIVWACVLIG